MSAARYRKESSPVHSVAVSFVLSFLSFDRSFLTEDLVRTSHVICVGASYACFFPPFFPSLMLQVHARDSEFNLNLIDNDNCNRGSASSGGDMLHVLEHVRSDVARCEIKFIFEFEDSREISRFDRTCTRKKKSQVRQIIRDY